MDMSVLVFIAFDSENQAEEVRDKVLAMHGALPAHPKTSTDKVREDLKGVGGTVIRTSFDHAKEAALKEALRRMRRSRSGLSPDESFGAGVEPGPAPVPDMQAPFFGRLGRIDAAIEPCQAAGAEIDG
jgi:hypothetical protein